MPPKEPLKDVLKQIIGNIEKKEKEELDLLKFWEEAIGKGGARHTKIAFLKPKRLVVNVSDSTWLYKLTMDKKNIIKKFNKQSKKKIKELQFRIGKI